MLSAYENQAKGSTDENRKILFLYDSLYSAGQFHFLCKMLTCSFLAYVLPLN